MGLGRRYNEWLQRQDQKVTERKGATWQREFDERMLGRWRRLFAERSPAINGKFGLAHRLTKEGRDEDALDLYQQVVVQRAERYGQDHPKTMEVQLPLATALARLGRNEEARDILSSLLDCSIRVRGEDNAETLNFRLWLASVLIDLGQYSDAQEQLAAIFQSVGASGTWWHPKSEERTKHYWELVTSDDLPD